MFRFSLAHFLICKMKFKLEVRLFCQLANIAIIYVSHGLQGTEETVCEAGHLSGLENE